MEAKGLEVNLITPKIGEAVPLDLDLNISNYPWWEY